jgi:beta-lactamase class A
MNNRITLTADLIEFSDNYCRELINTLLTKIETINERTKEHTLRIKKLEKELTRFTHKK